MFIYINQWEKKRSTSGLCNFFVNHFDFLRSHFKNRSIGEILLCGSRSDPSLISGRRTITVLTQVLDLRLNGKPHEH